MTTIQVTTQIPFNDTHQFNLVYSSTEEQSAKFKLHLKSTVLKEDHGLAPSLANLLTNLLPGSSALTSGSIDSLSHYIDNSNDPIWQLLTAFIEIGEIGSSKFGDLWDVLCEEQPTGWTLHPLYNCRTLLKIVHR